MTPRERAIDRAGVLHRAQQARAYLEVAQSASSVAVPGSTNVAGSNAVLAGIAAADAICGHTIGARAAGDAHAEAISLLQRATPPGSRASTHLRRLLSSKTDTQYSSNLVSVTKAAEMLNSAEKLIEEMERLLRS